jgi:hypothetical protein
MPGIATIFEVSAVSGRELVHCHWISLTGLARMKKYKGLN